MDIAPCPATVLLCAHTADAHRLSLEEYLEVGRKRAPNFDQDSRRVVYQVYEAYERKKRNDWRWVGSWEGEVDSIY